jgi:hypothetical protein
MSTREHQGKLIARAKKDCLFSIVFVTVLFAGAATNPAVAQVQLPTVNLGDTNFEDAFGAPGWLFEEFPDGYVAGELKDSKGQTVPGSGRVTSYSTTRHVVFLSKKRFLGGWLAGEALQPVVDVDVRAPSGSESRVRGFADLTVGTGLQWAPQKIGRGVFSQRAIIDVVVPVGKYSDQRSVNIGNHFVVVNPYYAATFERRKLEFSTRLHYLWNSTNNDPFVGFGIASAQPGQAFHTNYAASYELFKDVRLGFNGYWLQQLIDHQINGVVVPNSKERTVGLGPGIQVAGRGIWFRANSYMEIDVCNRPSGIKVTFRIAKALQNGKP